MLHYILGFLLIPIMLIASHTSIAQSDDVALGLPSEVIASYEGPNITPLMIVDQVLYDRVYRRVEGNLAIFNAPGGGLLEDYGPGFNYVTLSGTMEQGDWTQIGAEQWLQSSVLADDVHISRFAGFRFKEEMPTYTVAWVLRHLRASEIPGADESPDNPFLYRYTRVSLFDTVEVDGFRWYQIGENQWVHQFNVAKAIPVEKPDEITTSKWVSVDLYEQVLIAYEDEQPVFATLVSTGLASWPTNEGIFNVYVRYDRTRMAGAYGQPDFYYLEEVPWTMYFDGDIGLHGTYWHDGFGYRQSHGCVNLSITDSKWLYDWSADVRDYTDPDSLDMGVYVFSSGEYQ